MPGIPSNHMPDMPLWQHGSSCQDMMPCHRPCRTSLTTSRQFREGSCQMVMSSQQIWKPTRHSMCPRNEWCDDAATKQIIVCFFLKQGTQTQFGEKLGTPKIMEILLHHCWVLHRYHGGPHLGSAERSTSDRLNFVTCHSDNCRNAGRLRRCLL